MDTVIIAAGSNLGDRHDYLKKAGKFLSELSEGIVKKSSIWESEPVGDAKYTFLNSAILIETTRKPDELLNLLKDFERKCGREKDPQRWGPRVLDLDIIGFGDLVIDRETLIIPHPEYHRRLFVLCPMMEIIPEWTDPRNQKGLREIVGKAPEIEIKKTDLRW
ncbi:2-amino-4-hydroxy-6-hydroxymethyldihydropteridine diphosphokinase [Rhodohalobacter mucosus]|uniref:2-amino-4-hydroxy-6-hydroxymethyldihydropteridine pyrophosphokinase n=1 Tax=Rhodohalobacter mucosus TaxID=2079485 RepID=A0A316TZY4_9BACT|nr:2-amino-4-hydroxy-6-hydroxymethyldihydropteridine diphosphokinase [Rhodohalobacter mucosus]PWN05836.1 2-amino-4-hydroxy-6-hydroxymethyldihydropteridine diphosphokinase [Rhodohalobacter mucosus]